MSKNEECPWDKIFPDTEKGAMDYLKAECREETNFKDAKVICDPYVNGVWKIHLPHEKEDNTFIIYLKGYKNPWGQERDMNDWECVEERTEDSHPLDWMV
jgi:hypothetical protein